MGLPKPNDMAPARASVAPADRVVFGQSFETLLKACGDPPRPEILAAFREHGVDMEKPLQVAYPLGHHHAILARVRQLLYPTLSDDEAFFRLGRGFIERYSSTMIGRALLMMLPVLGPRRVLGRLTQSFRSATNYVEASAEEVSARHFLVRVRPVKYPGFYRGLLTAGLEVSGAKGLEVKVLGRDQDEITFELRWAG